MNAVVGHENMTEDTVLSEQVAYYRARAAENDEWHTRQGRYDKGEEHRRQWLAELDAVRSALEEAGPFGDCLELACGRKEPASKAFSRTPETAPVNSSCYLCKPLI